MADDDGGQEMRARLAESHGRWVLIAQARDEAGAATFMERIRSRRWLFDVGEWVITVREDKRRARSGGAFVVWGQRRDVGKVDTSAPAGRWVRSVRVWRWDEKGSTSWAPSGENPSEDMVQGLPPRIVDEEYRRQLVDRLPRASPLARGRARSLPDRG